VLGLLIAVSLLFYGWWNPLYVPLLGSLAVFNFLVARAMAAQRLAGRSDRISWLLTFGIVGDLLALGYFKYTNFLIDTANVLFKTDFTLQYVLLPIGISFFTFQKIAYLVDSSRGEVADHDFLEYCFFIGVPQLLAGPIVKHHEIFPHQGSLGVRGQAEQFVVGLTIFIVGLFKLVLADNFAPSATGVFDAAAAGEPLDFFLAGGCAGVQFQLYFDFAAIRKWRSVQRACSGYGAAELQFIPGPQHR
jgi:D-alanyl-lipoteichoic acid acyltransferase DltB (MBOAT superfamily)